MCLHHCNEFRQTCLGSPRAQAQASRPKLDSLLLRQAAAAEQRERLRLEHEAELRRVQLLYAQHHLAACECVSLRCAAVFHQCPECATNRLACPPIMQGASSEDGGSSWSALAACVRWRLPCASRPPGVERRLEAIPQRCCSARGSSGSCWLSCTPPLGTSTCTRQGLWLRGSPTWAAALTRISWWLTLSGKGPPRARL